MNRKDWGETETRDRPTERWNLEGQIKAYTFARTTIKDAIKAVKEEESESKMFGDKNHWFTDAIISLEDAEKLILQGLEDKADELKELED